MCGKLAVPVDYNHPDGDVATLAMIRFPATGDKIGSLVINPGGPGESGIDAALGLVADVAEAGARAVRPGRVRPARGGLVAAGDVVQLRRRQRPAARPNRRSTTAPAGVAHIEDETKAVRQPLRRQDGQELPGQRRHRQRRQGPRRHPRGLGDDKLTYLGYSYGTRIGSAYAEAYPQNVRAMILDGAVDPNADPIEADLVRPRDSRTRSTTSPPTAPRIRLPAGHRSGQSRRRSTTAWSTRWSTRTTRGRQAGNTNDPRGLSYSDAIVGTIMALYSPTPVAAPDRRAGRVARPAAGTPCSRWPICTCAATRQGHYTNATDARVAINCVDQPADHRPRQGDRRGPPDRARWRRS